MKSKGTKKPEPEKDAHGYPIITKKYLRENCYYDSGYDTPELNDVLYLNMRGFRKIENVEEYNEVKVLYLEGNALRDLSNISHMTNLISLYLHDNMLSKMIDMSSFTNLTTLTLANNMIDKVEGVHECSKLKKIDLNGNRLTNLDSFSSLRHNKSLRIVLLKNNNIEYDEAIIDFLANEVSVAYLEMAGNPFAKSQPPKAYRRLMITRIESLGFLDDEGITYNERELARAYIEGGRDGEVERRRLMKVESDLRHKRYLQRVADNREQAIRDFDLQTTTDAMIAKQMAAIEVSPDVELFIECFSVDWHADGSVRMSSNNLVQSAISKLNTETMDDDLSIISEHRADAEITIKLPLRPLFWSVDLENSLENLLLSHKFNFQAAEKDFNSYLESRSETSGFRYERVKWQILAKKWTEMQKTKKTMMKRPSRPADETIETISNTELPSGMSNFK